MTDMRELENWLDQVEARLDAVKRLPIQEDREHETTFEAWSDLYEHAPTDLARAHHIITRMVKAAGNHPDPCDKYPDDDTSSCGWRRAYASVIWALKGKKE